MFWLKCSNIKKLLLYNMRPSTGVENQRAISMTTASPRTHACLARKLEATGSSILYCTKERMYVLWPGDVNNSIIQRRLLSELDSTIQSKPPVSIKTAVTTAFLNAHARWSKRRQRRRKWATTKSTDKLHRIGVFIWSCACSKCVLSAVHKSYGWELHI